MEVTRQHVRLQSVVIRALVQTQSRESASPREQGDARGTFLAKSARQPFLHISMLHCRTTSLATCPLQNYQFVTIFVKGLQQ